MSLHSHAQHSLPYRDATWFESTFDLHLRDCWAGLLRAMETNLFDARKFDKHEYLYYDDPANGDLHEVVNRKFIAFKGPRVSFLQSLCLPFYRSLVELTISKCLSSFSI